MDGLDAYSVPATPAYRPAAPVYLPSEALRRHVRAKGVQFAREPARAHDLFCAFVASDAYMRTVYPAELLEAARADAAAHCMPATWQMLCET